MLTKIFSVLNKYWLIWVGLFLGVFVALRLSYLSSLETQPDSGLFESFGYFLSQGKRLYTDIFDHKPPGIYWVNQGLLWLFGFNENSIILGVFGAVFLSGIFIIAQFNLLLKNKLYSILGGVFFVVLVTQPKILGSGNYTELYGVIFLLMGIFMSIKSTTATTKLYSNLLLGCSFLFKEPFIISSIPFLAFNIYSIRKDAKLWFVLSSYFGPLLFVIARFYFTNQLQDFWRNEVYSFGYSKKDNPFGIAGHLITMFPFYLISLGFNKWLATILILLSIIGVYLNQTIGNPHKILLFCWLISDYVAVSFPGNQFDHYLIQIIPSITFTIVLGCSFYLNLLFNKLTLIHSLAFISIFYIFIINVYNVNKNISLHFLKSHESEKKDIIVNYFEENVKGPVDCQIISKYLGSYCLKLHSYSNMYFPIPYPYMWYIPKSLNHHFIQKIHLDLLKFRKNPPKYILGDEELCEMYTDFGLKPYLDSQYTNVICYNRPDGKQLWLKKLKQ